MRIYCELKHNPMHGHKKKPEGCHFRLLYRVAEKPLHTTDNIHLNFTDPVLTFIGHLKSSQCLRSTVTYCLQVSVTLSHIMREEDRFTLYKALLLHVPVAERSRA